jgi:hypothetical protein
MNQKILNNQKEYLELDISSDNPLGIGDALVLTPAFKFTKKVKLNLSKEDLLKKPNWHKNIHELFGNIAEIQYIDQLNKNLYFRYTPIPHIDYMHHAAQANLYNIGIDHDDIIPKINITDEEKINANNFINDIKNPVFINYMNNRWIGHPQNQARASHRFLDLNIWQIISTFLKNNGFTVCTFSHEEKDLPILNDIKYFHGYSLRFIASIYSRLLRPIITIDTAHHHLSLASGGKAICLYPVDGHGYLSHNWIYTEDKWKYERIRSKNIRFDQIGLDLIINSVYNI